MPLPRVRPAANGGRDVIASLPKAETRTQRETGNREGCCGHEIILGSQVSAVGCLVQVFRFGCRFGRCLAQPLTANRFHLIWVGSALRADLVRPSQGGRR